MDPTQTIANAAAPARRPCSVLTSAVLLLLLMGCRSSQPLFDIGTAAVPADHSAADVRDAFIKGGAARGWVFSEQEQGHLVGTLSVRDHRAIVDVHYSASEYSIRYKDSLNLDYDNGEIHPHYNTWVANLSRDVQRWLHTNSQ